MKSRMNELEIAQILGRLRFVKQTQRRFIGDRQKPAELLGIGRKFLAREHVRELLLQLSNIELKVLELTDVERTFENEEVAPQIVSGRGIAFDPEDGHQNDHSPFRMAIRKRERGPGAGGPQIPGAELT
jgi:hypothetical protein